MQNGQKMLAVLLDPEKCQGKNLSDILSELDKATPDFIFIGGSSKSCSPDILLNEVQKYPIAKILFPGDTSQFDSKADALLFLSLISGRNADYLIGQHVRSALEIKKSGIEVIPTGYILINGGKIASVNIVSETQPISSDDLDNVLSTAVAGELLGMKLIYLEAGSGATHPVPSEMIAAVKKSLDIPLIVGGGISSVSQLKTVLDSGADLVVVGNHFEKNSEAISEFIHFMKKYNEK